MQHGPRFARLEPFGNSSCRFDSFQKYFHACRSCPSLTLNSKCAFSCRTAGCVFAAPPTAYPTAAAAITSAAEAAREKWYASGHTGSPTNLSAATTAAAVPAVCTTEQVQAASKGEAEGLPKACLSCLALCQPNSKEIGKGGKPDTDQTQCDLKCAQPSAAGDTTTAFGNKHVAAHGRRLLQSSRDPELSLKHVHVHSKSCCANFQTLPSHSFKVVLKSARWDFNLVYGHLHVVHLHSKSCCANFQTMASQRCPEKAGLKF